MDRGLYIAMSGARQSMAGQAVHANNLANVNTTGFRSDYAQLRSMPVFGEYFPTRVYAMTESPASDFSQGNMMQTGRNLDIAIDGKGWIAVQAPNGEEALTRSGGLNIDVNGFLRTGEGFPVLGNGGPVNLPPFEKIEIGKDGSISIRGLGQNSATLTVVDRIKLVNPIEKNLQKGSDGLIRTRDGSVTTADAPTRITSGFIEGSNVNAVEELTSIISSSRQFDTQIKMMQTIKENDEASVRILQVS